MSYNPFDEILQRLERIEQALAQQSVPLQEKPEEEFLTRKDAANAMQVSLPTLHYYTKEGIIKGYRFGSRVRYKKSEVEASLNQIRLNS